MVATFPNIFPCSYPFLTHLKSIFVAGPSWKVTQIKPKFTWLTFIRSEEDSPLRLVHSNISLHDHMRWGLFKHFLLLGRILVSKWGLGPNIKVWVFAPHNFKTEFTSLWIWIYLPIVWVIHYYYFYLLLFSLWFHYNFG